MALNVGVRRSQILKIEKKVKFVNRNGQKSLEGKLRT
jgi:hypothetical protein